MFPIIQQQVLLLYFKIIWFTVENRTLLALISIISQNEVKKEGNRRGRKQSTLSDSRKEERNKGNDGW